MITIRYLILPPYLMFDAATRARADDFWYTLPRRYLMFDYFAPPAFIAMMPLLKMSRYGWCYSLRSFWCFAWLWRWCRWFFAMSAIIERWYMLRRYAACCLMPMPPFRCPRRRHFFFFICLLLTPLCRQMILLHFVVSLIFSWALLRCLRLCRRTFDDADADFFCRRCAFSPRRIDVYVILRDAALRCQLMMRHLMLRSASAPDVWVLDAAYARAIAMRRLFSIFHIAAFFCAMPLLRVCWWCLRDADAAMPRWCWCWYDEISPFRRGCLICLFFRRAVLLYKDCRADAIIMDAMISIDLFSESFSSPLFITPLYTFSQITYCHFAIFLLSLFHWYCLLPSFPFSFYYYFDAFFVVSRRHCHARFSLRFAEFHIDSSAADYICRRLITLSAPDYSSLSFFVAFDAISYLYARWYYAFLISIFYQLAFYYSSSAPLRW